jgi:hypothetical protein
MSTARTSSRALELLIKIDMTGLFDRATLARELVMTEDQLERFMDDEMPIPLDRQLCLAQFVIERVPVFARAGHRLKGQVIAAISFNARVTATHADAPPPMFR